LSEEPWTFELRDILRRAAKLFAAIVKEQPDWEHEPPKNWLPYLFLAYLAAVAWHGWQTRDSRRTREGISGVAEPVSEIADIDSLLTMKPDSVDRRRDADTDS